MTVHASACACALKVSFTSHNAHNDKPVAGPLNNLLTEVRQPSSLHKASMIINESLEALATFKTASLPMLTTCATHMHGAKLVKLHINCLTAAPDLDVHQPLNLYGAI